MVESANSKARTVILVGRPGDGKSATGNSIIGDNVFEKIPSSPAVSTTYQLQTIAFDNGQILNVIDTPGLFDLSFSDEPGIIRNEIGTCIRMANNCIHAVVVVLSPIKSFTQDQLLAIQKLKRLFGEYLIVVLTHGDAIGQMPYTDYLALVCSEPLKGILDMCGNRYVVFDNMTKNQWKKSKQQKELLSLVDTVLENGGIAYSNELFADTFGNGVMSNKAYEEKIESKFREAILRTEKQLADEQAARKQAEAMALEAEVLQKSRIESEKKFKVEWEKLEQVIKQKLDKGEKEAEMLRTSQRESEEKLKTYEEQLLEMELMTLRLEKQLKEEQVARMQAEADQIKSKDEIRKLRENLKRAHIEARKQRKTHKETKESLKKMIQEKKDKENQKKTNNSAISEIALSIEHQIESKLRETTLKLENQLADKFARMQAEEALRKSNDEMRKLREDMERAQRYTQDTFEKIQLRMGEENQEKNNCSVYEIASTIEHQIDSKYRERIVWLETVWAEEHVGRMQAEARIQEVEKKSKDEVSKLREDLERTRRDGDNQLIESEIARLQAEDEKHELSECFWRKYREVTNSSHSTILY